MAQLIFLNMAQILPYTPESTLQLRITYELNGIAPKMLKIILLTVVEFTNQRYYNFDIRGRAQNLIDETETSNFEC